MTDAEEQAYLQGRRAVYTALLQECLRELGYEGETVAALIAEREAAIVQLRELCRVHGDNDWKPDLHLADIISKHVY